MSANLPTRMAQRQAVELGDALRDADDRIRRIFIAKGFDPSTVDRELEHGHRLLAVQYSPERLP